MIDCGFGRHLAEYCRTACQGSAIYGMVATCMQSAAAIHGWTVVCRSTLKRALPLETLVTLSQGSSSASLQLLSWMLPRTMRCPLRALLALRLHLPHQWENLFLLPQTSLADTSRGL